MDTKKYEALIKSINSGSLTSAAKELGYTQSGLTHMMNSLEAEIGFTLFNRNHNGLTFTSNGQKLLPYILDFLASAETLNSEIKRINSDFSNCIRIGCYTSMSVHWLPLIMEKFREKMPNCDVDIKMGGIDEIYSWVFDNKIDLIMASREYADKVNWVHLYDDPLLAILPKSGKYDSYSSLPIEEFDGKDFLMPYLGFDKDINRAFAKRNAKPNIKPVRIDDPAIIAMVEHGWGITILSKLIMTGRNDNVYAVPLNPNCFRELGIAYSKTAEITPQTQEFISCAKEVLKDWK